MLPREEKASQISSFAGERSLYILIRDHLLLSAACEDALETAGHLRQTSAVVQASVLVPRTIWVTENAASW